MQRNDVEFFYHVKDHRMNCDGCGEPIGKELAARLRQGLTFHDRCLVDQQIEGEVSDDSYL